MIGYRHIVLAACVMASHAARAQVAETVLHAFSGGKDGALPTDTLLIGTDQSGALTGLYGTTSSGDANLGCTDGVAGYYCGSVFSLLPPGQGQTRWKAQPLYDFTGYADEDTPVAGLFSGGGQIGATTPLYGTTLGSEFGYDGSVFMQIGTTLTTIWNFSAYVDGQYPYGGAITDQTGAVYVPTVFGGAYGCGTVVQLLPPTQGQLAWTENILWNFTGGTDGCNAYSALIEDSSGALYGTTLNGAGSGGVFKLTPPAAGQTVWTEQMLYGFTGGADGGHPFGTLAFGLAGTLYGTTAAGGAGYGVVFQLTPPAQGQTAWTEQALYSFTGGADGAAPLFGALLIDSNGALYGTASGGGVAKKCGGFGTEGGTVFKLTPPAGGQGAWSQSTLFDFPGGRGGCIPTGGLAADSSGALYGTTEYGGSEKHDACKITGCGTVFRLTGTGFTP